MKSAAYMIGCGNLLLSIGVVVFEAAGTRSSSVSAALGFAWVGLLYFALAPLLGWIERREQPVPKPPQPQEWRDDTTYTRRGEQSERRA